MDAIVMLLRFPVLSHNQTLAPHSEAFYHVLCNIFMYCNDLQWAYYSQHLTHVCEFILGHVQYVVCVQGICSFLLGWKQLNHILNFLLR